MTNFLIPLTMAVVLLTHTGQSYAQDTTTAVLPLGGIKASAFVEQKKIPLNRELKLTVRIEWHGGLARFDIEELEAPVLSNLEIVGTSSSNRVGEVDGEPRAVKEYEFLLRPVSLGMGYIEGVIVKYRDTVTDEENRLITNRLQAEVIDPVPEPGERRLPVFWIVVIVVALAALGTVVWTLRERREERRRREAADKVVPLEEVYLDEMKTSFDVASPGLDIKDATAGLSRFYRRYLAQKYDIRALEATTDEVLVSLREKEVEERLAAETSEILKKCDVLKFGGVGGESAEVQRIYTLIEDILQRNLRTPAQPKPEANGEAQDQKQ